MTSKLHQRWGPITKSIRTGSIICRRNVTRQQPENHYLKTTLYATIYWFDANPKNWIKFFIYVYL